MKKPFSILAIMAVILLAALAATPVLGGGEQGLEKARQAQENHTDALLAKDGVVGTALGLDENGNAVIQVFTSRRGVGGIPAKLDGVAVQVKVTGAFEAQDDETTQYSSPVPIGVSSSNENSIVIPFCYTGTLGARLVGLVDGSEVGYGLSNNHVYANVNGANGSGPGSSVIQPGLADSSCTTTDTIPIGTLTAYVPIDFDGGDNLVDAAIAKDGNQASPLIGTTTPEGLEPSTEALTCENDACGNLLNTLVQKRGRTTHLTQGEITGVNAIIKVNYGKGKKARFVDQLVIESPDTAFSAGGDSGSLVVTDDDSADPVGLLFAGSSTSTIVNRIDLVFSELASNVCSGCTLVFDLSVDGKAPVEDTTGPTVTSVDPADSATGAAVTTNVTVSFSEPVDPNSVTSTTFTLTNELANLAGVITVADDNLSATFDPDADLTNETAHTVTVTSGVTDTAGNALDPAFTSSFTTEAAGGDGGVSVDSIAPNAMDAGTTISDVTIKGSGFVDGADVTLENGNGPAPAASNVVVVDANTITLDFSAKSGGPSWDRVWDVRVTNLDGTSGVCGGCFTVHP
ncbi:MAG: Ig-like domain-containing protein [Chloroflexi bacterium]|nr:Ig-like domain-containing protein [Chloroflexota bacterium]